LERSIIITLITLLILGFLATKRDAIISLASILTPTPVLSPAVTLDSSWHLVFNDEFEETALDINKWLTMFPWGRSGANSSELQYYAEDAFELINGIHRIRAEKRSMAGYDYTSGIITSYGTFHLKYGYVEIRAKMPKGQGLWPAFWLLPVDQSWPPEIDVFEVLGHEPNTVYMTNHWGSEAEHLSAQSIYNGPDFSQDFHTFGIRWEPNEIIWYIDGLERFRSNQGVPAEPMYLLANLAVGGEWPGNPDETTPFPSYLEIDYIRVYQRANSNHVWLPIIVNGEKTQAE
jgi:beta-glucanase (GH16 family)